MATLAELLGASQVRPRVVSACARLIDEEMARKRGLRAMALKAGYKTVKGLRPGFVPAVVDFLLDEFCAALDPFYRRWSEGPADARPPLARALEAERDAVAEALLGVTDRRADRSTNRVVVKIYRKLRPTAKEHVLEALPGLGRSIEPFLRSSV